MLQELNQKLEEVKERLRMKQKLAVKAGNLDQALREEKARLAILERDLNKEDKDVEKLEGLSVRGLFYSILGSKHEQLEKERREFLTVKLKYDECKEAVTLLQETLKEIQCHMRKLGNVEEEYDTIFADKEKLILSNSDINAKKLFNMSEKISDKNSDIKELKEAFQTGKEALNGINDVIDSLQSAKGWGAWDLLGGGLISTAIKHSRIDDARQTVHKVQHLLRIFQRELKDVEPNLSPEISIDIGSLATFADYFFDGLISDWIVQSKINDSLQNAVNVGNKVIETIKTLKTALENAQQELKILEAQRTAFIEGL